MRVVEIFLPVYDNHGQRFSKAAHNRVKEELYAKFSGLTAYTRSPAEGIWRRGHARSRDAIMIYEIMVKRFNRQWWRLYRKDLEKRFRQDSVVIRSFIMELI